MNTFPDLKRYPGLIYEVLISTKNVSRSGVEDLPYNIAPMGMMFENKNEFIVKPFKSSTTYENLRNSDYFGLNFTHDALLFYKCIYEKEKFVEEDFKISVGSGTPTLNVEIYESVQMVMIAKKRQEIPTEDSRARFKCVLEDGQNAKHEFEPLCRANNLALEAIVHSTRIKILEDQKKKNELKALINQYHEFIKKTAGNSIYLEIMEKLKGKIKEF